MKDLRWTDADQEHFIETEKEDFAELLKCDWSFARMEELLICIDSLRGELIAWAEGR
jgi:hypothetical protein